RPPYPSLLVFRLSLSFSLLLTHPAPPALYPLSLHDALPISSPSSAPSVPATRKMQIRSSIICTPSTVLMNTSKHPAWIIQSSVRDRKSTRLNSSHVSISYAVFCLKKKTKQQNIDIHRTLSNS